jgi:hypothetical protein
MAIRDDIKDVCSEIGESYLVRKQSGVYSGEYLIPEPLNQLTSAFSREFLFEATLQYDTLAETGDVLSLLQSGIDYLLINKSPQVIENEVIEFTGSMYKCNVSGELRRPSYPSRGTQYQQEEEFTQVAAEVFATFQESQPSMKEEEFGNIGITKGELYLAGRHDIKIDDRYVTYSGEYYRVMGIKKHMFSGIEVAILGEDRR